MGGAPSTAKDINKGGNAQLQFVACGMRGWREEMEDFRCAELNIDGKDISFFGVFDGHGGKDVARYCSKNLLPLIKNTTAFKDGQYEVALNEAFLKLDVDLRNEAGNIQCFGCGSTAVTCLVVGKQIFCANVGDSRAVLCRNGCAIDLSRDHKPEILEEKHRVEKAGGFVKRNRVNGILSMSRAMGDFSFKMASLPPDQMQVICIPEVKTFQLEQEDEFFILASDGVWDAMTSQQAVNFVRQGFDNGADPAEVVSDMFHKCLGQSYDMSCVTYLCADLKHVSYDNMTAIVVQLKQVLPSLRNMARPLEAKV